MVKVRVNGEGWIALPKAVRRKLKLATGEQLELELVGGSVVLRPARPNGTVAVPAPAEAASPPAPPELEPAAAVVPPAAIKRGPGRPRKIPTAIALPPTLKARGARRKVASAEGRPS